RCTKRGSHWIPASFQSLDSCKDQVNLEYGKRHNGQNKHISQTFVYIPASYIYFTVLIWSAQHVY
ncbi:hypothetical protein BS47DRAFT_1356291, partial [Hydnum rufescens UP504]